jgi:NADPH-dependent curcumin reductase CurA
VASGKLTIMEDRVDGLAAAPALMERLVAGKNVGKAVVAL